MRINVPALRCLLLIAVILASTDLRASEPFPRISGERLSGSALVLPDGVKGQPTLFIISFSRNARTQTAEWGKRLKERKQPAAFDFLQVLELEEVPKFFRGFVKSSLKKSVGKDEQARFVLTFEGTDALKAVTAFRNADEAYLLLVDSAGMVQWREHGAASEQKLESLEKQLHSSSAATSK
jgi:homogentisate 1,2-dioxygenase